MKKEGKCTTKRKNCTERPTAKTAQAPRIVTGSEIPNLLKKRPFKIRYY